MQYACVAVRSACTEEQGVKGAGLVCWRKVSGVAVSTADGWRGRKGVLEIGRRRRRLC